MTYLHSSKSCLKETLCLGESPSEFPVFADNKPAFAKQLWTFPCHHFCLFSYVQRYLHLQVVSQ